MKFDDLNRRGMNALDWSFTLANGLTDDHRTAFRRAVAKVVDRALSLVKQGWCQNFDARDVDGRPTGALDPSASCFCTGGAVHRATTEVGREGPTTGFTIMDVARWVHTGLRQIIGGQQVIPWNDALHRKQADVVKAFEELQEAAYTAPEVMEQPPEIEPPPVKPYPVKVYDLKVHVGQEERDEGKPRDACLCPVALATKKAIKHRFRRWKDVNVTVVSNQVSIAYHTDAHPATRTVRSVPGPEVGQYIQAYDMGRGEVPNDLELTLHLMVPEYEDGV